MTRTRTSRPAPAANTIAAYWMRHGYSQAEAERIERQQIREAQQDDCWDLDFELGY